MTEDTFELQEEFLESHQLSPQFGELRLRGGVGIILILKLKVGIESAL